MSRFTKGGLYRKPSFLRKLAALKKFFTNNTNSNLICHRNNRFKRYTTRDNRKLLSFRGKILPFTPTALPTLLTPNKFNQIWRRSRKKCGIDFVLDNTYTLGTVYTHTYTLFQHTSPPTKMAPPSSPPPHLSRQIDGIRGKRRAVNASHSEVNYFKFIASRYSFRELIILLANCKRC